MNEIVNKFLLAGYEFKTTGLEYSAWGPFRKGKDRLQEIHDIFLKTN